jgi:tripartite-type tricarboxylate transporter receptor subunit TctC
MPPLPRRRLGLSGAAAALAALGGAAPPLLRAGPSRAQSWPDRPIRLVVPFPPGGVADLLARSLAPHLQALLGQPIVVENRAGAGGNVGADAVAKSPPDGNTLLLSSTGPLAINAALYGQMPFDPATAFAPVALALVAPMVLVVRADRPWRGLGDVLEAARAAPGRLSGGSAGNGSTPHLALELLKSMARVDITHVPYRGVAPATTALLGGDIQMMFDTVPQAMPQIRGGALRPLAVTTARRVAALPEVPTVAEAGVAGYESSSWFGVVAPAGTPAAVVARLADAVAAALRQPEVVARFAEQGGELEGMGPEAFAAFIRAEREKWTAVVQASGARLD